MKKNLFLIAAIALMGICMTACSSGDDEATNEKVNPKPSNETVPLTGTLGGPFTRSTITEETSTAVAKWVTGDEIAIRYQQKNGTWAKAVGTITTGGNNTATFTATLSNPKEGDCTVNIVYPNNCYIASSPYYTLDGLATQDGTLVEIGAKHNIQSASSNMTVNGSTATLNDGNAVQLENHVCIAKFNLKGKDNDNAVFASKLIVTDGTNTYTMDRSSKASLSTFYVAMKPTTTLNNQMKITITTRNYTSSTILNPNTLSTNDVGKIIAVNGSKIAYLCGKPSDVSPNDIIKTFGESTLVSGKFYPVDVPLDIFTPVAIVAYVGEAKNKDNDAKYCTKFIALALDDVPTAGVSTLTDAGANANTWAGEHSIKIDGETSPYNTIPSAAYDIVEPCTTTATKYSNTRSDDIIKGWRIPSVTDWRYVFQGLNGVNPSATNPVGIGDHEYVYSTTNAAHYFTPEKYLQELINTSCGNNNLQPQYYWTSSMLKIGDTTYDGQGGRESKGWRYSFIHDYWMWNQSSDMALIRAVLAY